MSLSALQGFWTLNSNMRYQLKRNALVWDSEKNISTPLIPGNRYYEEYSAWVAAGNTPDPIPPLSAEEQARIARAAAAMDWVTNAPTLATITPEEAETWIENGVTDLASAKAALKKLAKALIYLRNRTGG